MKPGPKKGYKQTTAHIEKRKRFGPDHPNWVGSDATVRSGRTRAERIYADVQPCESCGQSKKRIDRHHKDGDTLNNAPDNIQFLCRRCHMIADGRMEKFLELARINQPVAVAARWN